MNTIDDRIFISPNENKMNTLASSVDETARNLGVEAAIADQYATLIFEMPVYSGFESLLGDTPKDLTSTANFWRDTIKPALMRSVGSLRSFCSSYSSYFPELLEALKQGTKDVDAEKENLLKYLHEISPEVERSLSNLADSQKVSQEFLTKVEGSEEKLKKTVPAIQDKFKDQQTKIKANEDKLKDIEDQIERLIRKCTAAMTGVVASGSSTVVGGVFLGVSSNTLRLSQTGIIAENTPFLAGRFASLLAKKIIVGVSTVFVVVNIVAFAAAGSLWRKYDSELAELRKKQAQFSQQAITLNVDAAYLNNMQRNFSALLTQASKVSTAFNSLQEKWQQIDIEIKRIIDNLKNLSSTLNKDIGSVMIDLKALNDEFLNLKSKLEHYELNFVLPVKFQEIPSLETDSNFFSSLSNLYIPNGLYNSYTRH